MLSRSFLIPLHRPKLPRFSVVESYLSKMDESRIYSNNGPLVQELKNRYGEFLGVPSNQVVCVSNATLGIQGALEMSSVSDWYLPDFTFAATASAALQARKNIKLVDVNIQDYKVNLSYLCTEDASNFGVIPVMPFGAPVLLNQYHDFPNLVIDAACFH
jgi:dTDP-4-amino-4,6-dideoxygalactose transaminase